MTKRKTPFMDWRYWLGGVVSAVALYFALRGVEWKMVLAHMGSANWFLLVALLPLFLISLLCRALRWRLLIRDDRSSLRSRYNAITIGFFVTNIIPRAGEIVRGVIYARREKRSVIEILTTIVVERVFDLLALIVLFTLCLPFIPLDAIRSGSDAAIFQLSRGTLAGAAGCVAAAGLIGFVLACKFGRSIAKKIFSVVGLKAERLHKMLDSLFDGLETVYAGGHLLAVLGWSFTLWLVGCLTFYMATWAFPSGDTTLGAILGPAGAIFLQVILCFGVALPTVPGFFGVWQLAAKLAFTPYPHADQDSIMAFAILLNVLNFLMIIAMGLESLGNEGMKWSEVSRVEAPEAESKG